MKLQKSLLAAAVKGSLLLLGTTAVLESDRGQGQQAEGQEQKKQGSHFTVLYQILS
jgi:hypothetical protein